MNSPPGMDPEATYKFVDIIEVPTDEIEDQEEKNSSENDDDLMASVNDANWPDPIPVNGPNSNLNMGGLLESVNSMLPKKWLDPEKNSAYSREFGTYIGRFQPRAHGISGMVSRSSLLDNAPNYLVFGCVIQKKIRTLFNSKNCPVCKCALDYVERGGGHDIYSPSRIEVCTKGTMIKSLSDTNSG